MFRNENAHVRTKLQEFRNDKNIEIKPCSKLTNRDNWTCTGNKVGTKNSNNTDDDCKRICKNIDPKFTNAFQMDDDKCYCINPDGKKPLQRKNKILETMQNDGDTNVTAESNDSPFKLSGKVPNIDEEIFCSNKNPEDYPQCQTCDKYNDDNIKLRIDDNDKIVNYNETKPYYLNDIANISSSRKKNHPSYDTKCITKGLDEISDKKSLQKLRCFCDYALKYEISKTDTNGDNKYSDIWDLVLSGDIAGLQAILNPSNTEKTKTNELLNLVCRAVNTTNPRTGSIGSIDGVSTIMRLTGWVGKDKITVLKNIIFLLFNFIFFTSFASSLSGANVSNIKFISDGLKNVYNVYIIVLTFVILFVVFGSLIYDNTNVETEKRLLTNMAYASAFVCVITLVFLFITGMKLVGLGKTTVNKTVMYGIYFTTVLIVLSVFYFLYSSKDAISKTTVTLYTIVSLFIVFVMYVMKMFDIDSDKEYGVYGLLVYSATLAETLFGVFFPYIYFMIILVFRIINGMLMGTSFWTLIPLHFASVFEFYVLGKPRGNVNTALSTSDAVGSTDRGMFTNNLFAQIYKMYSD